MNTYQKIALFTTIALVVGMVNCGADPLESESLFGRGLLHLDFVSYASLGGGVELPKDGVLPRLEVAAGIQFLPWFGLGAFTSVTPLSNPAHASLGISYVAEPNAYSLSSGTELVFTPFVESPIHPYIRLTVGGVSVGYGEETDAEGRTTKNAEKRFFHASASGGAEINLTRHLRLAARAGWHFAGNDAYLGMSSGALSGPEAALTLRYLWRTVID